MARWSTVGVAAGVFSNAMPKISQGKCSGRSPEALMVSARMGLRTVFAAGSGPSLRTKPAVVQPTDPRRDARRGNQSAGDRPGVGRPGQSLQSETECGRGESGNQRGAGQRQASRRKKRRGTHRPRIFPGLRWPRDDQRPAGATSGSQISNFKSQICHPACRLPPPDERQASVIPPAAIPPGEGQATAQ